MELIPVGISALLCSFCWYFASAGKESLRRTRDLLRSLQSDSSANELELVRVQAVLRRQQASIGALSKSKAQEDLQLGQGDQAGKLPDPLKDPEAWRAAVRRMQQHQNSKPTGDLQ